jgi:hypothetical protein
VSAEAVREIPAFPGKILCTRFGRRNAERMRHSQRSRRQRIRHRTIHGGRFIPGRRRNVSLRFKVLILLQRPAVEMAVERFRPGKSIELVFNLSAGEGVFLSTSFRSCYEPFLLQRTRGKSLDKSAPKRREMLLEIAPLYIYIYIYIYIYRRTDGTGN